MLFVYCLCAALAADPKEEQAKLLSTFRDEFIEITPGEGDFSASFRLGTEDGPENERPGHAVELSRRFWVARYEVPQNLYEAVMGKNPSKWKGPRNSVEMVSFDDAQTFCRQATELLRAQKLIDEGQVIRLPSEAEWEYCARAGTTTRYSFGDEADKLGDFGWFTGNAAGNDPPVGAKQPNAWELYDVHGYLWEWCADGWHENYAGAPADGSAWAGSAEEQRHVLRGGSWKDTAEKLTSSFRRGEPCDFRDDAVGLRCILADK